MEKQSTEQLLAELGKKLDQALGPNIDYKDVAKNLPTRSLSGDHIIGGTIRNFSSTGIRDDASQRKIHIKDGGVEIETAEIKTLKNGISVEGTLNAQTAEIENLTVSGLLKAKVDVDFVDLIKRIPNRALSGNLINGGVIKSFASQGIKDSASTTKLLVEDSAITVDNLKVAKVLGNLSVEKEVTAQSATVGSLTAEKIFVKELRTEINIEKTSSIEFKLNANNPIYGKGIVWTGGGKSRSLTLKDGESIFSSEDFELLSGKSYNIGGVKILDEKELGSTVTKSNLKEVGKLRSLTVNGDVNLDNRFFYSSASERIGFGTENPRSKFSIADQNVEILLDISNNKSIIGNYGYNDLEIVTDNKSRITVGAGGVITLGDSSNSQVVIKGKLSVGIQNPDPAVDLHVNGAVRFNNKLQSRSNSAPQHGSYQIGDIFWNSEPKVGSPIGWVCILDGNPGEWKPFGIIGH